VQIGLSTPVVVQVPGVASAWEHNAGIKELVAVAEVADSLGFDYLTCSEHVAVPIENASSRGSTYWDPVATLSYLAACTSRIRLKTSVVVLGYHHPLELAKSYGTLDRISGGRLTLGVGVGSLVAEFELLGVPWDNRGRRADDAIRAVRAALSAPHPAYHGEFYSFQDVVVEPYALQTPVPLWVGGRSAKSLRRAVDLADGWMPFGLRADEIASLLANVDLPPGFNVVLPVGPLDPGGEPNETRRRLRRLRDIGATAVTCAVAANSIDHYLDQLATLLTYTNEFDDSNPAPQTRAPITNSQPHVPL
jgi:probable F420-dependent oxidoreductase